ncbi:MAG: hypothetical protein KGO48_17220 [Alphaproteobacteria bacterium]|nr:hypothetical protein [Alphaproteobacteria bacterium]
MSKLNSYMRMIAGSSAAVVAVAVLIAPLSAQIAGQTAPPDFSGTGWVNEGTFNGGGLVEIPGQPYFKQDARYPHVPNNRGRQPTYWIADLNSNPNVKPWAKEVMKKDNEEIIAGKIAYTARSSCDPAGVPGFDQFGFQPVFFLQEKNKVTMLFGGDQQVRHVYLGVPHSASPKLSWYGESVGHYEGDTLVVDTVGLKAGTMVDNFRTPHSDKLHVTERWRIIENDSILEVTFTVEDPDTFEKPWSARQRFRRVTTPYTEEVCIEGNLFLHQWKLHIADKGDF